MFYAKNNPDVDKLWQNWQFSFQYIIPPKTNRRRMCRMCFFGGTCRACCDWLKIATLLTRALWLAENRHLNDGSSVIGWKLPLSFWNDSEVKYIEMIEMLLKSWQSTSNEKSCSFVEIKGKQPKMWQFIYFSTRIPMVSITMRNFLSIWC